MRLDLFLKNSRIIKRRTLAKKACDTGRVRVNEKEAKASLSLNPGDLIEIEFGDKTYKFKVLSTDKVYNKGEAEGMYQLID